MMKRRVMLILALSIFISCFITVAYAEDNQSIVNTSITPDTAKGSVENNTIPDPKNNRTNQSYTTIQAAINDALSGDTILIDPGTYKETISIDKNINLVGSGIGITIIDGEGKDTTVKVHDCTSVIISDLTITNGATNKDGGGIWNKNVNLTLNNVQVMNSQAGTEGGGIWNGGTLTINNSTITNNEVTSINDGGGIYNDGILIINNSSITGNGATYGGGIRNYKTLILNNSIITGNSADVGGGVYNSGAAFATNTQCSGNSPDDVYGNGLDYYAKNNRTNVIYVKIQDAINDAQNGDTILIGSGTYQELLNIEKNINLIGSGEAITIIDGQGGDTTVKVRDCTTVTISDLIISNGATNKDGGAIWNDGVNLTLNNIEISSSQAGTAGGGIYNSGTLIIDNGNVHDNTGKGGGIYNIGTLILFNSNIYNNIGGIDGGGIYNDGNLTVNNCTFTNNQAGHGSGKGGSGGAIYNSDKGILTVTGSNFNNNQAGEGGNTHKGVGGNGGNGGAVYNNGYLNLTDCSMQNNSAGKGGYSGSGYYSSNGGDGGAIYNDANAHTNIINCNISNNHSGGGNMPPTGEQTSNDVNGINGGNGGAIYNSGNLNLEDSTLNNNQAANGCSGYTGEEMIDYGGGYGGDGGNGGAIYNTNSLTIKDCIISHNMAGNGGNGGWGAQYVGDEFNGGTGGNGGAIYNSGVLTITGTNQNSMVINYNTAGNGGNGGPGQTVKVTEDGVTSYDNYDAGNGEDGGSGGAIYNTGSIISITNTQIEGNNAGNGGEGGTFHEHYNQNPGDDGDPGNDGSGGGIFNSESGYLIDLENTIISNNNAGQSPIGVGGNGGGLYITNMININNCNISNNNAGCNGGGIYLSYGKSQQTNIIIKNSIISSNAAGKAIYDGGNGGGIFASSHNNGNWLDIEECTITNNQAGKSTSNWNGNGGGLYYSGNGTSYVIFCRIVDNSPQAIYYSNFNSAPVLQYNWWGSNAGPGNNVTGTNINPTYYTPWLVLSINAAPSLLCSNQTSNVNANLIMDSYGEDTTQLVIYQNEWVPDGIPVTFASNSGSVNPQNNITTLGSSTTTFYPTTFGNVTVSATVDYQTVSTSIYVPSVNITVLQHPWYFDGEAETYQTVSSCYNTIVYDVDVVNTGVDEATNVVIKEVLGEGYQLVGLSTEGVGTTSYDSLTRTITWNIASIPTYGKAVLSLNALVTGTGNNTPNLVVNASLDQVDQYNAGFHKWSDWSVYVAPSADIQINQTQEVTNETDGQYITYTITAKNNGPDDATAIQITDNLPSGLIKPAVTPSSGTYTLNSNEIIWVINSLTNNSTAVLTIKARINTNDTFANTATKTGQDEFDWEANNNAQTCVLTLSGDYTPEVNMNVKQYPWYYNDRTDTYQTESGYYKTIVYSVVARNSGVNDATGVIVKEFMGDGYLFLNCTTKGDGTSSFDSATNTITWNIGYMPTGGKVCLSVFALVIATGNNTPDLTVNASLAQVDQYDVPGTQKWASYSLYVPGPVEVSLADYQADLYIVSTLSNSSPKVGETFTIKFKLNNYGPDNAQDVKIKIPIPEGLEFVNSSASNGLWYYDKATRTLIGLIEEVEVGNPDLVMDLKALKEGQYVITPIITSTTYLLSAGDVSTPVNIYIAAGGDNDNGANGSSVNGGSSTEAVEAASNTVGMQETGIPLTAMILAILMVISGLAATRRK